MFVQHFCSLRILPAALATASFLLLTPRDCDGQIYADFETSLGNFTIEFFHEAQPMTVASFVGLAEGSIAWLDFDTLKVMKNAPYFDGIKFHRVIKDFMIQGGSPNGRGTDGPGYSFVDRFARNKDGSLLHPHDQQGLISMANSGINTNGSQFFITDVPTPWLNNLHVAFGKIAAGPFGTLAEGITVITAMNDVPTTATVPDEDLVILSITIRRVGAEAEAFDVHAQGLPVISEPQAEIVADRTGTGIAELTYEKGALTQTDAYRSSDLENWELLNSNWFPEDDSAGDDVSAILAEEPLQFFRINKVDYSQQPHAGGPDSLANATLKFTFESSPLSNLDVTFDKTGAGGTWAFVDGGDSGVLTSAAYTPRARVFVDSLVLTIDDFLKFQFIMQPALSFDTLTSGRFSGSTNVFFQGSPLDIKGTFELITE